MKGSSSKGRAGFSSLRESFWQSWDVRWLGQSFLYFCTMPGPGTDRDRSLSAILAYLRGLWCHRLRGDRGVKSQQVSTLGVPCNLLEVRVLWGHRGDWMSEWDGRFLHESLSSLWPDQES